MPPPRYDRRVAPDTSPDSARVPAVSVIIPAYNAARTIARQLDALTRQHVDVDWEVIVCDNGSTDATSRTAQSWADRLPLRVIDASARRGPSAARNAGADAARAPLLAFCDADDAVTDDWLSGLLPVLGAHPFVVTAARVESAYSTPDRRLYDVVTTLRMPFLPELPFGSSSHLAVSAEAFTRVGRFDETLRTGEDVDLSWRLQLAGYAVTECREAIIDHSRRAGFFATVRQFRGYQHGRRALQHRYAHVIDAFTAARGAPPGADGDWEAGVVSADQSERSDRPASRRERIAMYLRDRDERRQFLLRATRSTRLALATSLGLFLGRVTGRIDTTQPQVPASLARAYLERERPFERGSR
ncbi:hypothetical protein GCM10025774_36010 [Microbacterium kyungheense]|uniref:4,4'-diaponeurosporenoate glycosyltransferase n=1 Tax=Microbacterium kyungheense TaxID=1263636 RepID=A0A543ERR1_9MICO|nr:glycosyl transferase family 2 [Microbacterium kyungheense]